MKLQQLLQSLCGPRELENYFATEHLKSLNLNKNREKKAFELCVYFGIIPSREVTYECPTCKELLQAVSDQSECIGYKFKCPSGHAFEATTNTFLNDAMLNIVELDAIICCIHGFVIEISLTQFIPMMGLEPTTAITWYQHSRSVTKKIAWHDLGKLGGPNDVVEVACKVFTQKSGEDYVGNDIWIFGGISRSSKKMFAVVVQDQTQDTLLPLLREYIDKETVICSDNWEGYKGCEHYFMGHEVTNNKKVGSRLRQYNTKKIQIGFRQLKKFLQTCPDSTKLDEYIGEWMYRTNILRRLPSLREKFVKYMSDIQRAFPGIGLKAMKDDKQSCDCHECL